MKEDDATGIVSAARRRALGSQPRWRRAVAVLWSAFLGGCCTLAAALLAPDSWTTSPLSLDHLTIIFVVAWALSLIPALSASLLAAPPHGDTKAESGPEARTDAH